ncbi:MAG: AraC family transcriptional regulator [Agathobacter sp.]|nr:AraC family transcriptional regulator [Agathobacter sp.]
MISIQTLMDLLPIQKDLFHIPFYLYEGNTCIKKAEPVSLDCPYMESCLPAFSGTSDQPSYYFSKDLLLFGKVPVLGTNYTLVIGPARASALTSTNIHNILISSYPYVKADQIEELTQYLNNCAIISFEMFLPILCSLHGFINDKIISSQELLGKVSEVDDFIRNQMIETNKSHTYEEQPRHSSIDFEARIMFYISQGMCEKFRALPSYHHEMGSLAHTSLRHYQNALIILNTLSQRAAILGGLNPETAYQLGEIYIQKIEACKNINDIMSLNKDYAICMDYCERVAAIRYPKTNNAKINAAMHFIQENYTRHLNVKEIAKEVGLSPEYLSSQFHKLTGTTLPLYISKLKVAEAKNLLRFTDMPLSEISEYLSFSSQSYFQSVFKKETGDTPNEYRRLNKLLVVK